VVVQIVVTSDTDWMVIEGGMVEKCPYITHHDVIFDKCIPFNISQAPTKAAPTAGPTFLSEQRKLSGYINGQAVQSQNVLAEHDVVEGAAPVEFTYDDDVPTVNPEAVAAYVSCRFPLHSSYTTSTVHITFSHFLLSLSFDSVPHDDTHYVQFVFKILSNRNHMIGLVDQVSGLPVQQWTQIHKLTHLPSATLAFGTHPPDQRLHNEHGMSS
jgi:hypothetical protein